MDSIRASLAAAVEAFNTLPHWAKAGVGLGTLVLGVKLAKSLQGPRKSPWKEDWAADVVYLYQIPRAAVLPSLSPYSLKLETWLRMAGINYENVDSPIWLRSKEGMVPFIELNGKEHDDSGFIIRDLLKLCGKEAMEAHMTPEQRGASRAIGQMIENSTMQSYVMVRYCEHAGELFDEKIVGAKFLSHVPWIMTLLTPPWLVARMVRKKLAAHGIGRHSRDEIVSIGLEDMDAISAYLGDKNFLTGTKPVRADASLFGLLSQLIWISIDTPHTRHLHENCGNLVKYAERIKAQYWPDWEETCRTGNMHTDWRNPSKYKAAPVASPMKQ